MSGVTVAPNHVVAVLLADGWHRIVPGSFSVGPLRFGAEAGPGTPGFRFEQADPASPYGPATLAGPLGSILAVRHASSARHPSELSRPASGRWGRLASEAVALRTRMNAGRPRRPGFRIFLLNEARCVPPHPGGT